MRGRRVDRMATDIYAMVGAMLFRWRPLPIQSMTDHTMIHYFTVFHYIGKADKYLTQLHRHTATHITLPDMLLLLTLRVHGVGNKKAFPSGEHAG